MPEAAYQVLETRAVYMDSATELYILCAPIGSPEPRVSVWRQKIVAPPELPMTAKEALAELWRVIDTGEYLTKWDVWSPPATETKGAL